MKRVTASLQFDYNPETDEISNMKIVSEGSEKKVTKTRTAKKKDDSEMPMVFRDENKLVLNSKLIEMLGLTDEDRVNIIYDKVGKLSIPLLGKAELFGGKSSGNKLTKSNTVAFRGNNNTILAEYGTSFNVELYKEGIVKLISLDTPEKEISTVEQVVKKITPEIVTEEDTEYKLKDDLFNFNDLEI